MKTSICLILVFSLIALTILSCEKENANNKSKQLVLTGELINNTTCKNGLKSLLHEANTPDSLSCVEYVFDKANNKLTFKHINAGFNCCPESLYVQTSLNDNTITIQEHEANALCDCNCLYDLDIELNGVEAKKYWIIFIEPYAADQQEISFEVDLNNSNEGEFCVTRKQYPWGVYSMN